jgi:hypothetical protein
VAGQGVCSPDSRQYFGCRDGNNGFSRHA